MAYKLVKKIIPYSKYNLKCPYVMTPTRVVIHNTANDASAQNEIAYMTRNDSSTSFHYAIDHVEVVQGLQEYRNSWQAGDGENGAGNRKAISIEICYSKSGGGRFTAAEKNAAAFTASILYRRGWGVSRVTKHQDYSGKYCPHRTLDMGWQRFLNMVGVELDKLNKPEPAPPPPSKINYKAVDKTVILIRDAKLWNFDFDEWGDAKAVASFPRGHLVEVVAEATNSLGAKYYMTDYSYNSGKIRATNGFNVADCRDYTPPPVVVEPPKPVPPPEEPEEPHPPVEPPTPPVEPDDPWWKPILQSLIDFINEILGIKKG